MEYGLLLPHFGEHATPDRLLRGAARAEELGFDALYVRDHLLWRPHGFEGRDPTFIDPFVTLAAAGAVTKRVRLGTAVVIPTRWPLKLAQDVASLSWLSGGRAVLGIGLGRDPKEFAANGFEAEEREQIFQETVEICRLVWTQSHATYRGTLFSFEDVSIDPKPAAPVRIDYGGSAPAALRRAVRFCDGWQPGRVPLRTLDKRLATKRRLEQEHGRRIRVAIQPIVTIAHRYEEAARRVPIDEMGASAESAKWWDPPPSGKFETIADLEGLNIVGTPDDVHREILKFHERDVDEVIIDLRLQFDQFQEALELLGREVLPRLKTVRTPSAPAASPTR